MKPIKRSFWCIFVLCLIISTCQEVYAVGGLYVRPRFSTQQYQNMWIKNIDVNVSMQDQTSTTTVDQTFYNEMNTSVEAIYIFPLPEGAMITKLEYWFNGQKYEASIREKKEADADYNNKVRQWMDPALLEYLGTNLFKLSIVPVNALSDVRTRITYVELLKYDFGKVNYTFLLNTMKLSSKPVQTVHLFVDANSQNIFKYFNSPSHEKLINTKIIKLSDLHYTLEFGDENFTPSKDLLIQFETVRNQIQINLLTYTPTVQDSMGTSSFYTMWITPPDSIANSQILPKDIVFTVDVSSSMEGTRIQQAKSALNYFLNLLNPGDRFNIVTFGTFVDKFKPDLVPVTQANIDSAKGYVYKLYALGLTNIDDALIQSLKQSYLSTSSCNLIFLTDGQPTWGETKTDSILSHLKKYDENNVRIFSFGIGDDISKALLTTISSQCNGYAQFIKSDDSISTIVSNHFIRISKPVMKNISIDMGGLTPWDQYPKTIEDLYWGSQLIQFGLYDNKGTFNVTLSGKISSSSFNYNKMISFTDTSGGYRFVPRLWAKAKIDYLLGLIQIYGESAELVKQVTDLSLRFQILTPYSAFYSDPTLTSVVNSKTNLPDEFLVKQNYPNPFNPGTTIEYNLPLKYSIYHVIIRIYNSLGQFILTINDKDQLPGVHKIYWSGKNSSGNLVASGIYYFSVQANEFVKFRKMILLK